ncbi:hypothetical protein MMC24_001140 [Lignoscripta atroalba]|nr:hypothetical protein [Lignoscripta atroalba]
MESVNEPNISVPNVSGNAGGPPAHLDSAKAPAAPAPETRTSLFHRMKAGELTPKIFSFMFHEIRHQLRKNMSQPEYAYRSVLMEFYMLITWGERLDPNPRKLKMSSRRWSTREAQQQAKNGVVSDDTLLSAINDLWEYVEIHRDNHAFLTYTSGALVQILIEGQRVREQARKLADLGDRAAAIELENQRLRDAVKGLAGDNARQESLLQDSWYDLQWEKNRSRENEAVLQERLRDERKRLDREIVRRIVDHADNC